MTSKVEERLNWLPEFMRTEYEEGDAAFKHKADKLLVSINPFSVDEYTIKMGEEE
jgi:hypothetical protein